MATDSDSYVARHSTVGSGAAGRATDGEVDATLRAEEATDLTAPRYPDDLDMSEMPDPTGSHHDI